MRASLLLNLILSPNQVLTHAAREGLWLEQLDPYPFLGDKKGFKFITADATCHVVTYFKKIEIFFEIRGRAARPRHHASRGGRPGGLPLRGSRA